MIQGLFSVDEVAAMIQKGDSLLLAGNSDLLKTLPKGKWIAGITSQFIEKGKELVFTSEKIFVHNVTDIAADIKLKVYDASSICNIYDDAFENGFSVLIMPFHCHVKTEYALNCMNYSNFASRSVCGWISITPTYTGDSKDVSLVFSGESGLSYDNAGVVMHIALPPDKYSEIHTFNPFVYEDGDVLVFEESGQQVENVLVNGVKQNFRQYLIDKQIGRSLADCNVLAGDYEGVIINATISPEFEFDRKKYISFGNPVFKGIMYRFTKLNHDRAYNKMNQIDDEIVFSFSCITNHEVPNVFLKYLTHTNGPFVYGEIAYFLLNHSTVYVTVGSTSKLTT